MTPEQRDRLRRLVGQWNDAADRHAREARFSGDDERDMHEEAARIYRRCADDLSEALE